MVRKVNKTLSLTDELAERLEDEENQSKKVEETMREHYGMEALQ